MSEPRDPRTCGACSSFAPSTEGTAFGECGCDEARGSGGRRSCWVGFGCRFFTPADPSAYRAGLIELAAPAAYGVLHAQAGRKSSLPEDFDKLQPATRERCEVIALRVLQAAGVL